jgi:hypothetical protein
MSLPDLLPAPSAPAQTDGVELQVILDSLLQATEQADRWADYRRKLLDTLFTLRDLGRVEDRFTHAGWGIQYSPGRTSYDYSACPAVIDLEAKLQEAREAAVVARVAVQKPSTPFWVVRRPRPVPAAQEAA